MRLPQAAASSSFNVDDGLVRDSYAQSAPGRHSLCVEQLQLTIPDTQLFDRQLIGILY
jgi:hypothetical protein